MLRPKFHEISQKFDEDNQVERKMIETLRYEIRNKLDYPDSDIENNLSDMVKDFHRFVDSYNKRLVEAGGQPAFGLNKRI